MQIDLDDIRQAFLTHGTALYGGEAVSQLEHALQSAWLAEQSGEPDFLITAALLHDFGHLVAQQGDHDVDEGRDDLHEYQALPLLRPLFGPEVLEPIKLHVEAKRYLCHAEPGYYQTLSPLSRKSLELQGGVFSDEQAEQFLRRPFAAEAVRLRRYDDQAKVMGQVTPGLEHFFTIAGRCLRTDAEGQP